MNYKNFHGIYLKSDENIVHEARLSRAGLLITWLSIPGVLLIFFLITYVPYLIRSVLFGAVKNAVASSGFANNGVGFFDFVTEGIFGAIPRFLLVLLCIPVILLVLVWLGFCLFMTKRHFDCSLAITDFRVIGRSWNQELSASLDGVVNVFLEQSLWGRLFHYGNLTLQTQKASVTFYDIDEPENFRYLLLNSLEKV